MSEHQAGLDTTWEYAGFTVPRSLAAGEDLMVRAWLRNTGPRAGRDVVRLYLSRPGSSVERPAHWLAGFGEVVADAGRDAIVDIRVAARCFEHYDASTGDWAVEPGAFTLTAGPSLADLRAQATVIVVPPAREQPDVG